MILAPATTGRHAEEAARTRRPARRAWPPAVVITAYALLALAAYWPLWPGDPSRLPMCACADPVQGVWFLGFLPHALGHLQNPLFTRILDHPSGVNLAQNTEMPLLGLLTAPLTVAVSPVASFNLVMWLAYPLSATALYLVARRFLASEATAALAGLLYGFSAYVVGEGYGHPNLAFVPLPPVILLLVFGLLVTQDRPPRRRGLWLGAAIVAQFLVSPEILTTTAIVAVVGAVMGVLARPGAITADRLAHAAAGLLAAVALAAVVLAYPIWFQMAGPSRFRGNVKLWNAPFHADLLGPLVPTSAERLGPSSLKAIGDRFVGATFAENGSYLGVALVLACAALVGVFWRNRWLRFLAAMAVASFVLSLGSTLVADGHATGVPLPFALIAKLPVLDNILPARLSLYQDGFVALLVAVGLDELLALRRARAHDASRPRARVRPRRRLAGLGLVAAGVGALALLVPAWPDRSEPTAVPAFFSRGALPIPTGAVVLSFPFPVSPYDQAMLWQAVSGYRFDLLGGYALVPGPQGLVSSQPPQLRPYPVQLALGYEAAGPNGYLTASAPNFGPGLVTDFRRYLRAHRVDAVVLDPDIGNNPAVVTDLFKAAIGRPARRVGGVLLWRVNRARPPANGAPGRA